MRKHTQKAIQFGLIICIIAGVIGRCSGQVATQPVSITNAVTLKEQPTFPAYNEIDPISQRLTITYAPVTEHKTRGLKKIAQKLRRMFRPNSKT